MSMKWMAPLLLLLGLAACAPPIVLPFTAEQLVRPVPMEAATKVKLNVVAADKRTNTADDTGKAQPRAISHRSFEPTVPYGQVWADRPVADIVADAVRQELKARGYQIAEDGAPLMIEVSKLYGQWVLGFPTVGVEAETLLTVQYQPAAFSKTYRGYAEDKGRIGVNALLAVQLARQSFSEALAALVNDRALHRALQSNAGAGDPQ